MRITARTTPIAWRRTSAFFLLEATVGMALLGLVFMALYTGLCTTTFSVQLSREHLRATQVMTEKLETIRLYGWSQIEHPTYIGRTFTTPVYSEDPTSPQPEDASRVFQGEIQIEAAPVEEVYGKDLRLVTVRLAWQTGKLSRTRSMSTLVSKYGLYRYVY